MSRSLTTKNLFDKKTGRRVKFSNPKFLELIGNAEAKGCWLIYGIEKNGKTWFALTLARDLCKNEKIAYVSGEEGTDDSFREACRRAGITSYDRILWDEYMPIEDLIAKFQKPKSANIIFIDNLTVYADDFRDIRFWDFIKQLPDKLIICVAHEERNEPSPAVAKMARKLSKVIIHVKGLRAFISGRFSRGGEMDIDPEKAAEYWGDLNN
jgi:archaellum biogenesis ATPase FlaH